MSSRERESGFFTPIPPTGAGYESDAQLVSGLLEGKPAAWRAFERRFGATIEKCITKVLRRFKRIATEDAVEEVRSNMYVDLLAADRSKLRSWREGQGTRLSTWIAMIAIHSAHDYLRSLRREPFKEEMSMVLDLESTTPDPFQATEERENLSRTHAFLQTLTEKDRTFAALYFTEGLAPEEIARRLRLSINTVYSKRHKIQLRLLAAFSDGRDDAA